MQGAVEALRIERTNWAALENGQKMVDSFDYWCWLPVLKQLSIFSSSTLTKANSSVIIVFLEEGQFVFLEEGKEETPLQWQGWETSL